MDELKEKIESLQVRLARQTDVLLGELCLKAEIEEESSFLIEDKTFTADIDIDSLSLYAKIMHWSK